MFSSCVTCGTSVVSWQLRGIMSVGSTVGKETPYPAGNKDIQSENVSHFCQMDTSYK